MGLSLTWVSDIFAHGQAYVALSRVTSMNGVMLVGLTRGSFNNNKVKLHDQYDRLSCCPTIYRQSMSLHYKGWCLLCLTQTALSQASLQPFFKARRSVTSPQSCTPCCARLGMPDCRPHPWPPSPPSHCDRLHPHWLHLEQQLLNSTKLASSSFDNSILAVVQYTVDDILVGGPQE